MVKFIRIFLEPVSMKASSVVLSAAFAFVVLVGVVWVGRYPKVQTAGARVVAEEDLGPPISKTGPYPKAVADPTEFDFGLMALSNEGEHTFTIRNEGDADLVLVARPEDRTCQCTAANLSTPDPVPPGKSVDVTLHWHIRSPQPQFRHSAVIRTNDPKNKTIRFEITGKVESALVLRPESQWDAGVLSTDEPSSVSGTLHSGIVEEFAIEKYECANPAVSVTWEPLSDQQKDELKAKSGYQVKVAISPDVAVGSLNEKVKLFTSLADSKEVDLRLTGTRPGPVEFFGPNFFADNNILLMGEFPARDGKETTLNVFFRNFGDEVKLLKAEQKFNSVELDFKPVGKTGTGTAQRYLLKIKVPPGSPQDRQRKNSEKIDLHFNHPAVEKVRLIVDFLATEPAK